MQTVSMTGLSYPAVRATTEPRSGMNEDLHAVGAGYGVIKFWKGDADKLHWSTDGR